MRSGPGTPKTSAKKGASATGAPDRTDERLLTAAVAVFLEKGFQAASVDEIAARAKASKLTFYNRYGNKEALFAAVVSRQNAALTETLEVMVADGLPVRDFLEALAHRLYAALLKKDTVNLVRVLHAEADRFPRLADVFNTKGPGHAIKRVAVELEKYMACGTLRRSDPTLAAEHFLHLAIGELTRRVLLGLRPAPGKAEIAKRISSGIDVFLSHYCA